MKRETAIKYAREIAKRVHSINGLLATPGCSSEAVRIKRVWIFGSTAKGCQEPNDLDVLLDIEAVGRKRSPAKARCNWGELKDGVTDKRWLRSLGIRVCPSSEDYALKWLTKNMRKVSRHTTRTERGLIPFERQALVYPRWEFQDGPPTATMEQKMTQARKKRSNPQSDARDAARYRWLRDTQNADFRFDEDHATIGLIESIMVTIGDGVSESLSGKALDAAIDAEMLKNQALAGSAASKSTT